jgi:SAM-dependent methyltransferase
MMNALFFSIVFCLFARMSADSRDNGSVDHKNADIHGYLNEISEEQEEKTQILEHILEKEYGTYIDLGTGGDSIAYILNSIPDNLPIKIIGSDIDQSILQSIPNRHPEIMPYLNQIDSGQLRLDLLRMDATNMSSLQDSSIEGISASALTHEIFSYVPTKSSLDQFFIEIVRVLKHDGIFVYRDPKWDDNPRQDCLVILKDQIAKFFTVLFLPRLLDRVFSERLDYKKQCIKPTLYEKSHIRINFYSKGSHRTKKVKLKEFINTPLSHVDFTRNIAIEAPRGLISEIQRHYILFLKNIFITDLIDKNFFDRETINLENLPLQERTILRSFINKKNIFSSVVDTASDMFLTILLEKKRFYSFIENGISAEVLDKEKAIKFCADLYAKGINHNLIYIKDNVLWADAKIALLLFQNMNSGMYEFLNKNHLMVPGQVFEWMKREGEEFYFYKTRDEFITYVGQLTKYYLMGTDKEGYMLCPISPLAIKTVSRNLYKTIVDNHMNVIDIDGNQQNIFFDKNIIHFKLMKKEEALKIYKDIIKYNAHQYKELTEWVENDLR